MVLTPCGHEDGHRDGGVVVEDVSDPRKMAAVTEMTVFTVVTLGAHHELISRSIAYVFPVTKPSNIIIIL